MKKALRKEIRQRVAMLTDEQKAGASESLCREIAATTEWTGATDVLLYMALPDEISLQWLIDRAIATRKRVWLPVVCGDELEVRLFDPQHMAPEARFGIMEPTAEAETLKDLSKLQIALIPGRAFTVGGQRIGRGKGFYDRLLPQLKCPKWGVGFSCQRVEEIPMDSWDVVLDCVYFA